MRCKSVGVLVSDIGAGRNDVRVAEKIIPPADNEAILGGKAFSVVSRRGELRPGFLFEEGSQTAEYCGRRAAIEPGGIQPQNVKKLLKAGVQHSDGIDLR